MGALDRARHFPLIALMTAVSHLPPGHPTLPPRRVGVLLVNLGTPDTSDARGVRVYLKEFLSDPRVIEDQGLLWKLILNGIILRTRPRTKARDYRKIWNKERDESPLKTITRAQAEKLAQHQLADDVHAGIAVVQAGDEGKLLAAIVPENLGIFLRDFLQRLQAIGGEAGGYDGNALHPIFRQLFDGLVRIGLQPLVEAEARLKCKDQFRGIKAHALAQRARCCNALRVIGIALVDIFLRHAVE